jgi:antitoxin (DNA-binding transcriptional repressor) of toxin-antitoxin stability system
MTKTDSKPAARTERITSITVAVSPEFADKFAELASVRAKKNAFEKAEKELKAEINSVLPEFKEGQQVAVTAAGAPIATVKKGHRTGHDTDLLRSAFPEAAEATKTETWYNTISVL